MTHPSLRRLSPKEKAVGKAEPLPQQSVVVPDTAGSALAKDLLMGAAAIAAFMFGDEGERRRVYWLAESGRIPVFRLGAILCARKSSLLRSFEALERDAVSKTTAVPERPPGRAAPPPVGGPE
jgi:hypothetical protein